VRTNSQDRRIRLKVIGKRFRDTLKDSKYPTMDKEVPITGALQDT
jgi:hypothetical protein